MPRMHADHHLFTSHMGVIFRANNLRGQRLLLYSLSSWSRYVSQPINVFILTFVLIFCCFRMVVSQAEDVIDASEESSRASAGTEKGVRFMLALIPTRKFILPRVQI